MTEKEKLFLYLTINFENKDSNLDTESLFEILKEKISWEKYNELIRFCLSENLISDRDHVTLTKLGEETIESLKKELKEKEEDLIAERKKLHNESKISEYTRKKFFTVFILGTLGGLNTLYDFFITDPKNEREFQQIKLDILKNKDTIKELRTLILNQKKVDSLNHSNSELNK